MYLLKVMKAALNLINQLNFSVGRRESYFICVKSSLNIALLKLLLHEGLILGFYQFKHQANQLCVFLKYWNRKPLLKKIIFISSRESFSKSGGDLNARGLFILSTSLGGLVSTYSMNLSKRSRFGGRVLFKIIL